MKNTRLLPAILPAAGLAVAVAAAVPALAASGGPQPSMAAVTAPRSSTPGPATAGPRPASGTISDAARTTEPTASNPAASTSPGSYLLRPMPAGTVSFSRDTYGHLQAHVHMYGLTPGSAHGVVIENQGDARNRPRVVFSPLSATAAGQADTTLTSARATGRLPASSRLVIQLGSSGDRSGSSLLAGTPIAETGPLPAHPGSAGAFTLHAVTYGTYDTRLSGRATITFDAAAHTLTVSLAATGLTPGPHAAHIHLGSCQAQGPVKYMMTDFIADAHGDIHGPGWRTGQIRVITGVTSVPGPGTSYLNLHLGGMSQILSNGAPTLAFRPMLCTNISSFATVATTPPAAASTSPAAPSMASSAPAPTPTHKPAPGSSPSAVPAAQPTHW